jgi:hypothetical protein
VRAPEGQAIEAPLPGGFTFPKAVVYTFTYVQGADNALPFHSSVAQWQSIRLLTEGLLVRVRPEEFFLLAGGLLRFHKPNLEF